MSEEITKDQFANNILQRAETDPNFPQVMKLLTEMFDFVERSIEMPPMMTKLGAVNLETGEQVPPIVYLWAGVGEENPIARLDVKNAEIDDLKAQIADNQRVFENWLNEVWQIVYPGRTDWEYPAQAVRHLLQYVVELKTTNKRLEAVIKVKDETITSLREDCETEYRARVEAEQRAASAEN